MDGSKWTKGKAYVSLGSRLPHVPSVLNDPNVLPTNRITLTSLSFVNVRREA